MSLAHLCHLWHHTFVYSSTLANFTLITLPSGRAGNMETSIISSVRPNTHPPEVKVTEGYLNERL